LPLEFHQQVSRSLVGEIGVFFFFFFLDLSTM
jgi:hypothetical protein